MNTSSIQRAPHDIGSGHTGPADVHSPQGYKLLDGHRTISKSAQSKIKNFAYTLSTPFRALIRALVQNKAGEQAGSCGLTHIKARAASARTTAAMISESSAAYEVVGGRGGHGKFKPPPDPIIYG